ncbi:MAG: FtsX-like permease family protein [Faecalibacterium sp.]
MTKSYRKNILRELKSNLSRFLSLFGIVLLGVTMLTGLLCLAPNMRAAGQKYYAQQNVFDLRVLSTLGLSGEDVQALAAVEGVEAVQPVRWLDAEACWRGDGQTVVVRVQELAAEPQADTVENMNRLTLTAGRMPEKPGECVVHIMGHGPAVELGAVLELPEDTEGIDRTALTVVGLADDPLHFSTDGESSTAGDGSLDDIVFVADGSLTADYYTTCYIKVAGTDALDSDSDEYQAAVDAVAARVEAIGATQSVRRRDQLITDANEALDEARQTYAEQKADAEQQFAEAEAQLEDAQARLDAALSQLNEGEREYSAGKAQLNAQKEALPDTMQGGAEQLLAAEEQMLEFEDQLQQIETLVGLKQVADPLLGYAEAALNNAQKALDEAEPEGEEYIELRELLAKAQSSYDAVYNQLEGYQQQLDEGKRQMYEQGLISSPELSNAELVAEAKAALRSMKLQLLNGQLSLNSGSATAWLAFDSAEAQLSAARTRLDAGWSEYRAGEQELEAARAEYQAQKADAEAKLADGWQQILDAEEQVNEIESGSWYVLDRGSTMSIVTFAQYADRMEAIARVFPVFFFLVAALVASTTMTRMVDEDRQQLGILKALGYSGRQIAGKYLFYGLAASLLGSIAGMVIGFVVFPTIIWNAFSIVYNVPTYELKLYPGLVAASILISMAVIGLTTGAACRASTREKTAALLLPRAPMAGKRIFLEHIAPLWKRMSFSQKTTARNLLRYKKRFFMTVLGVAGCTALLLIGFGIQDSIIDIVHKQTTELNHADLTVSIRSEKALEKDQALSALLEQEAAVESWGAFCTLSTNIYNAEGESGSVTAVAAQDPARMTEYFTLRTRRGHEALPYEQNSAILTEKTAESLGLAAGDTFWVEAENGRRVEMTLTGVTENYLFTRLYLSPENIEMLLEDGIEWNTVYARTDCKTEQQSNALSEKLLACNYVGSVSFSEDMNRMFDNLIGSINYVVLLVILCAALLAAVVLYNLISVNLAERKKELATIRVLGFYHKEVYRYIFREIELLALIGSMVGLALGAPLHQFIIRTVEMDQMMFIRTIQPVSYLYSVALTMVFTFVVCFFMRRQVRSIGMVESMKAPE